jgi:uncharacterized protein YllA (UPF0747 family)
MNSRTYVILDASEVSSVDFDQVIQNSEDTLRYSVDGSKFIVKYEGTQPFFLLGKTEYTHEEILTILSGPEWASEEVI